MSVKKNRLGRGLDELISPTGLDKLLPQSEPNSITVDNAGIPLMVETVLIDSNPDQPRKDFNEKDLNSLSQSIKAQGIIEPLIVSKKENGRYELIAGERRLKAAIKANVLTVPVIIRSYQEDPAERLLLALVENICREDLNPIEEAESFSRLEKDFGKTHQEIATITGRERPTITNSVRLLKLPDFIQDDVRFGRLSAGHARALLMVSDVSLLHKLRTEVLTKNLTVRQTELLAKKANRKPEQKIKNISDEAYYESLSKVFSNNLNGLKVKINYSGKNKTLEINYSTNDDLELIMKKMGIENV